MNRKQIKTKMELSGLFICLVKVKVNNQFNTSPEKATINRGGPNIFVEERVKTEKTENNESTGTRIVD